MASQYTQNYQLNQWAAEDKVRRVDFNADNQKIDAALAGLAAGKAGTAQLEQVNSQLTSQLTQLSGSISQVSQNLTQTAGTIPKIAVGAYTGDGAASKTIPLSFTPKAVLVARRDGEIFYDNGHNYFYGGLAVTGQPAGHKRDNILYPIVQIAGNGFTVYRTTVMESNWSTIVRSNDEGQIYHYVAIG